MYVRPRNAEATRATLLSHAPRPHADEGHRLGQVAVNRRNGLVPRMIGNSP
jgi:hypothetical protein